VVVPVPVVVCVPVAVVHVIDVISMRNGNMAAPLAVLVNVVQVGSVPGGFALVDVIVVDAVQVTVVDVVHMILVRHGNMAAPLAVLVNMVRVGSVCSGHGWSPVVLRQPTVTESPALLARCCSSTPPRINNGEAKSHIRTRPDTRRYTRVSAHDSRASPATIPTHERHLERRRFGEPCRAVRSSCSAQKLHPSKPSVAGSIRNREAWDTEPF
jgi:hypothetical protein